MLLPQPIPFAYAVDFPWPRGVWWSVANALTGMAHSWRQFSVFRFMLVLGEAGGFTTSPKAVLGTAFEVIACGSTLGGIFINKGVAWSVEHGSYNRYFT